jgi:hypothetical protein
MKRRLWKINHYTRDNGHEELNVHILVWPTMTEAVFSGSYLARRIDLASLKLPVNHDIFN